MERAEAVPGLTPTPALLEERAHYLEKLGDQTAAEAAHAAARALSPTTARDYYLLATIDIRAGFRDKALAALNEAVRLNPRHYWSWVQRGLVRLDRREFNLAAADFGVCVGLAPEFAWGYFNRAYALEQAGARTEALGDYTATLERDDGFAMAYQNRGMIRLELGQHQAALADLDHALDRGRAGAALHAGRAVAFEALHRYAEAEDAIEKALALAKTEKTKPGEEAPAVRVCWTYAFAISGRKPELARQLFEDVLSRNLNHAQALYGLAMLATTADHSSEALSFFDRALQADPNFTHARRFRAVVLARAGRFAEAQRDINLCQEADQNSGPTLYAAACIAARFAEARLAVDPLGSRQASDQAIALLRLAFAKGYGADRVKDDPDLEFLRRLPDCPQCFKD